YSYPLRNSSALATPADLAQMLLACSFPSRQRGSEEPQGNLPPRPAPAADSMSPVPPKSTPWEPRVSTEQWEDGRASRSWKVTIYGTHLKLTWCKSREVGKSFPLLPPSSRAFRCESHHQLWCPERERDALLPALAKPAASPPLPLHTAFPTNWSHVFMPKQMKNAASED
uniref:Uncharacterized protein n=1 Tax=Calidris pygmaea TaxID=425635 RepID=A0A8C3JWS4_9CHAR